MAVERESVLLRTATIGDVEALLQIYAPYVENTAITFEYEVPAQAEFARRMGHTLERYPYLVAEGEEGIYGYAYAGPFQQRAAYDWAVETTIYVDGHWKRRGIGKKLYQALEQSLAAQNILNLNACIAYPEVEDPFLTKDSVAFHQRLGYRLVGEFRQCGYKFRRWYNMVWMEKHIGDHLEQQPPVIPFETVKDALEQSWRQGL